MNKTNKFDLGKDILNQSTATFKKTEGTQKKEEPKGKQEYIHEKKKTKPIKAIEEQKRRKVGIYFTDSEFEKVNEALMRYAQNTNKLPKMASFLHDLILKSLEM